MLQGEGGLPVLNESVEVGIIAQRQACHQGAVRGKASFLQMLNGSKKFARLTRMFIPSDMLQGGDADDQIIFLLRDKLDDVPADNTRSDLVLVDDVMANRTIVCEDVAELENPFVLILHQKFSEDRDFHPALVFPGFVVHVVQVFVRLAVKTESFGAHEAGQRHLHETPVSSGRAFLSRGPGVVVGIGQEWPASRDYSKMMREPGDFILKICKAL